jgi:hypothetical protein
MPCLFCGLSAVRWARGRNTDCTGHAACVAGISAGYRRHPRTPSYDPLFPSASSLIPQPDIVNRAPFTALRSI